MGRQQSAFTCSVVTAPACLVSLMGSVLWFFIFAHSGNEQQGVGASTTAIAPWHCAVVAPLALRAATSSHTHTTTAAAAAAEQGSFIVRLHAGPAVAHARAAVRVGIRREKRTGHQEL